LAPASEISVYDYSMIIFAAILGMLFLDEVPDVLSIIGYVVIIGSGVAMFFKSRKISAQ
ncbi:MAG: EamA family transporter, partial [Veillonella sp.]|nr:EamA family transporter [Veillonella sp.]